MFYVRCGNIESNIQWDRPNVKALQNWYIQLSELNSNTNKFKFNIVGGFAEKLSNPNIETWDIDIALTSKIIEDYNQLKTLLDDATKLAFENKILLDIYWVNHQLFNFHKNLSADTNLENIDKSNLILIRNFYDFEISKNDNTTYIDLRNNQQVTKLIDGLYMFYGYNESTINKVIQRIKDNIYKRNIIEIQSIYLL
jgi:hypothetical protein